MTCTHLQQLYQLCRDHQLKVGGTDLVRFVCEKCGEQEVCPSLLLEEYEAHEHEAGLDETSEDDSADEP
jgi:hypothetical protein